MTLGSKQFLNSFVVGVYRVAESLQQARIDAEKQSQARQEREHRRLEEEQRRQKERQEQERLREEADRRRRTEEARVQQLEGEVAAQSKAQLIRAYLAAVRQAAIAASGQVAPGSDLDRWLHWAEECANSIDPLMRHSSR